MKTMDHFRSPLAIALLLALAALLVFARVGGHEFLYYDDNLYVTGNPMVQGGLSWSGLAWSFTAMSVANWHPLTWLSHMLDVQLFGLDPGGHHLVNVLFHAANAVLLFLVLLRMTGARWRSAFVAALFALHPLHVESVAWVAERKDVLSGFFGLLALLAYVRYAERPGIRRYVWVVLLFALGLLCKPMMVTMPFLLLLLDYWPLGRMGGGLASVPGPGPAPVSRLLLEKIPLLALSAASSVVTVVAQRRGEAMADLSLGFGSRLSNAAVGYVRYLGKTFWPGSLSVFYPYPGSAIPVWQVAGACLLLLLVTLFVMLRIRRSPWLAVGWLWFAGTLVPVIGLVQVGAQSIADRYTYIPLTGIFIMVAWEVPERLGRWRIRTQTVRAASLLVIIVLTGLTWRQIGYWKDHETLFRHALSVTRDNCMAHVSLGDFLSRKGNADEAIFHTREALRLCPKDETAWYNLGVWERERGDLSNAAGALEEALRLKPGYANAWSNLGAVYQALGRIPEAADALLEVVRLAPDDAAAWFNLGSLYGKTGQIAEAIEACREAVRLKPDYAAAWNNLGIAYQGSGRIPEAISAFRQAAQLRSDDPVAWYNLGLIYAKAGELPEAVEALNEAVRARPGHAASWYRLGLLNAELGRQQEALEAVRQLRTLDPGLAGDLLNQISPGP